MYGDDLALCGESEKDLRVMVKHFVELYRRGLNVIAGKSKVMVLGGEEGLECEVHVGRICLEHDSEFKYLGFVLDETECSRKVVIGRRVVGAIRF